MGEQHANGWRVSRHRLVADATVGRIGALVVDPRRPHRHRARRRDHLAFVVMTVADHQPVTILIDLLGMGVDVGLHLRLQGDREHLPRNLAHDLIEHRTARLV